MTENEAKISTIAEDYKMVLHEAKSMGCNDIRALYHIPIKNMELIVQALEEIQQYRAIGTVGECREAVKKQTPRRVNEIHVDEYTCLYCFSENSGCDEGKITDLYCPNCGQKLDWGDEE